MANEKANMVLIGGGGEPLEVGFRDTPGTRVVLADITVDKQVIRKLMHEYLQATVEWRIKDLGADEKIVQEIDRRVKVAVDGASRLIEREVAAMATRFMEQRVREAVNALPLSVSVTVTSNA